MGRAAEAVRIYGLLGLVLAAVATGLVVLWLHHPFLGLLIVGCALLGAAVARAAVPPRLAGLLVNRNRAIDTVILAGMGLAIIALSASLENTYP